MNDEKRFQELFEQSRDAIYITTKEGKISDANQAILDLFGYTKEEFLALNARECYANADDRDKFIAEINLRGNVKDFAVKLRRKDGQEMDCLLSSNVRRAEDNSILGYQGIIRDITEHKQTEEKLKENEKKFCSLVENISDWVWEVDQNGIYTYASPKVRDLLGYNPEEVIGKTPFDFMSKDEAERVARLFRDIVESKKPFTGLENINIHKNGQHVVLETSGIPIFDSSGKFLGYRGIDRDITEFKRAEEELRKSEKELRLLTENMTDVLWLLDMNLKITYVSPSIQNMGGYLPKEYLALSLDKILTAKSFQQVLEVFQEESENEKKPDQDLNRSRILELEEIRKDGSIIQAQYTVTFLRDEKSTAIGIIGVSRDITELKKLQEQIELRQRMDSLGTLAGGLMHDFNNILAAIMGFLGALQSSKLNEIQKEDVKDALESAQKGAALIRQLQSFSRGAIRKLAIIDLHDEIEEVLKVLERTSDKLIVKHNNLEPKKYCVQADESELNQVFLNLGINAVDAIMEKGLEVGDFIEISANEHLIEKSDFTGLLPGEYIHISFCDTGCGMSEETQKKAFDPFFTTKDRYTKAGQGLGLAMVYSIIHRYDGYIEIESQKGQGATFHIYLPKAKAKEEVEAQKAMGKLKGNETILFVDDEEKLRRVMKRQLEKYGYQVITVADGEEALKIYQKKSSAIDLVVLDLTMPKMSGKIFFEEALKINPDIKVIISSGHSEEVQTQGIFAKAKGCLPKPAIGDRLLQIIRSVLDSSM